MLLIYGKKSRITHPIRVKMLHCQEHFSHPLLHVVYCVIAPFDTLGQWIPTEVGDGVAEVRSY